MSRAGKASPVPLCVLLLVVEGKSGRFITRIYAMVSYFFCLLHSEFVYDKMPVKG